MKMKKISNYSKKEIKNLTTTDLLNIFHDYYKEITEGSWIKLFCAISGIEKDEATDCYWKNKEIVNNKAANKEIIEFLLEVDETY